MPSKLGFEIVELSELYKRSLENKHDLFAPNRVDFNCLIYIKEGVGEHFIDFNRYAFQTGSFIFINAYQIHSFDFTNPLQGLAIFFTQEFSEETNINIRKPFFSTYHAMKNSPVLTTVGELKTSCENLLNEVHLELNNSKCEPLITQFLFSALMLKLMRVNTSEPQQQVSLNYTTKSAEFASLLETNYTHIHDAASYANKMGITYKFLNQICKAVYNKTPKQLIDSYIVLEAKRKLIIEQTPVNELAYELGFDEATNFIKYFKKHATVTPSQFKRTHFGS